MKNMLLVLGFISISSATFADDYRAKVTKQHTHNGCTYWNIEVWSDKGTTNSNDDVVVGNGTIRSCEAIPSGEIGSTISATHNVKEGCLIFHINLFLTSKEQSIASGAIGLESCF